MRLAAGLVAALVLNGCGGRTEPAPVPKAPVPRLATADCAAWAEMAPATRSAFVEQLRIYYAGKVPGFGVGQTIPNAKALSLLTNLCQRPHHDAVQLYRLYGPAVAFTPPG